MPNTDYDGVTMPRRTPEEHAEWVSRIKARIAEIRHRESERDAHRFALQWSRMQREEQDVDFPEGVENHEWGDNTP